MRAPWQLGSAGTKLIGPATSSRRSRSRATLLPPGWYVIIWYGPSTTWASPPPSYILPASRRGSSSSQFAQPVCLLPTRLGEGAAPAVPVRSPSSTHPSPHPADAAPVRPCCETPAPVRRCHWLGARHLAMPACGRRGANAAHGWGGPSQPAPGPPEVCWLGPWGGFSLSMRTATTPFVDAFTARSLVASAAAAAAAARSFLQSTGATTTGAMMESSKVGARVETASGDGRLWTASLVSCDWLRPVIHSVRRSESRSEFW